MLLISREQKIHFEFQQTINCDPEIELNFIFSITNLFAHNFCCRTRGMWAGMNALFVVYELRTQTNNC
jgi:hypothetical protein